VKCLDTDLLIAILRGKQEAYSIVTEIDEETKAATTAINTFEIFFGAHKSSMKNENIKEAAKLLDRLEVIPLDLPSSRKAAEISAKLAEKGEPIDYRDAMIAAIAIENDLTLVTRNKSHFKRIKNLKLETW
jgi:predicted nucleic acid-binding protein